MRSVRRLWNRLVSGQPDHYQAYVSAPLEGDPPHLEGFHDRIEDLERVFEGRIDVYARVSRLAIVSDRVPADQFDVAAFEAVLDRIDAYFDETHSVTCLEKWRTIDGHQVKSYVVVPVKPLFPTRQSEDDRPRRLRSPAE